MSAKRSQSKVAPRPLRFRRARWLPAFLVALGLIAVVAAGCGSSDNSGSSSEASTASESTGTEPTSSTLGWMVLSLEDEFFVDQQAEVEEIVSALGQQVDFLDAKYDPTTQLQLAQNWLNNGQVDAIAGSMADPNAFQPVLEQASKEKVPVSILGIPPEGAVLPGQTVITQDFKEWGVVGGEAMGKCINERYEGKAEVALLTGPNIPGP